MLTVSISITVSMYDSSCCFTKAFCLLKVNWFSKIFVFGWFCVIFVYVVVSILHVSTFHTSLPDMTGNEIKAIKDFLTFANEQRLKLVPEQSSGLRCWLFDFEHICDDGVERRWSADRLVLLEACFQAFEIRKNKYLCQVMPTQRVLMQRSRHTVCFIFADFM